MTQFGINSKLVFGDDGKSVAMKLGEHDASLVSLNNSLVSIEEDVELNTTELINQKALNEKNIAILFNSTGRSIEEFPRSTGETADSDRIQRAVNAMTAGDTLVFPYGNTYDIDRSITINKKLRIIGYGVTLRTVANGITNSFDIQNVNEFIVSGFKFDQNLQGRTSIYVYACADWIITDCHFTGYSKQFAYYQTDGGILLASSINGLITGCVWKNHGYQYGTTTTDLNRCISVGGGCYNIRIANNVFNNVNQAIVVDSDDIVIVGNIFDDVKDNSIYIVGGKGVDVTGNIFKNQRDECIVFGGCDNLAITGNLFKEVPNKIFAVTGNANNVTITGNTSENKLVAFSNLLAYRSNEYTVKNLTMSGNTFVSSINGNNYDVFQLGNVENLNINGNTIILATVSGQRVISINGATITTGVIANNIIKGSVADTLILSRVDIPTTYDVSFVDNTIYGRVPLSADLRIEGYEMTSNYAHTLRKRKELYSTSVPTGGTFGVGDIVWNITSGDTATRGWKCTTAGSVGSGVVFTAF